MKMLLSIAVAACVALSFQQNDDWLEAAVYISGASSAEDISADELESYERFASHPLSINGASLRELTGSGLFSDYQAASIIDYRTRCGDILSLAELSAVDGIGQKLAGYLSPFVSFEPGDGRSRFDADARLRVRDKNGELSSVLKSSASYGKWGGSLSMKDFNPVSFNLSYSGSGVPALVVIGDFNARFGQGLLSWTGFSMENLYTVSAFARNPTGLSIARTISEGSAKRGAAAELSFGGNIGASLYATLDGEQFLSVRRLGRVSSLSLSLKHSKERGMSYSADWRFTSGKFTLFGEAASLEGQSALKAGAFFNRAYLERAAFLLSLNPKQADIALGYERRSLSLTMQACHKVSGKDYVRMIAVASIPTLPILGAVLEPSFRLNLKFTPKSEPDRHDLRCDLKLKAGNFALNTRLNALRGNDWAFLGYMEAGWRKDKNNIYLRGTLFSADTWADRLYVYERDVPGSFSLTPCYGHGGMISLSGRWKWLSARLSATVYNGYSRPSRYELSFQADLKSGRKNLKPRE